MSRTQDERSVFHGKLADGLRNVPGFAGKALQLINDTSRAIQRSFNLGHDLGWRRPARRDRGCFLFHFLERLHLLENLGDNLVLLVLIE